MTPNSICVFCSSSDALAPHYYDIAVRLGQEIASQGYSLVYGGGKVGLMGAVSRGVHSQGGHVTGVIPEKLMGQLYSEVDELFVTVGMRERKAKIESLSDAFIGLPGGFGTLEEVFEIITLKQLQYHNKAIVLLNINGFYDHLNGLLEHMYNENFAKAAYRDLFYMTPDIGDALAYIREYSPVEFESKWY